MALAVIGVLASCGVARPTSSPIRIVSVVAISSAFHVTEVLNPSHVNELPRDGAPIVRVGIHNGGTASKAHVVVRLLVGVVVVQPIPPLAKTKTYRGTLAETKTFEQTLNTIGPNQTKTATFSDFGQSAFLAHTDLKVEAAGQIKVYPVTFEIPR